MKKFITFSLCIAMLTSTAVSFAASESGSTTIIGSADEPTSITITDDASENSTDEPQDTAQNELSDASKDLATEIPTAEPSAAPAIDPAQTSSIVNVNIIPKSLPHIINSEIKLELYNTDKELLATQSQPMTSETTELEFTFDVPQYQIGKDFILKAADGVMCVQYYDNTYDCGQEFTIETFMHTELDGNVTYCNTISLSAIPYFEKDITLKYDGSVIPLSPEPRVIDGVTMVPIRQIAEHIGYNVSYDEKYNSVAVSLGSEYIFFNVGTAYTTVFGTDLYAPYPTTNIDGTIYVPLRTLADAIQSNLNVSDDFYTLNIDLSYSTHYANWFANIPVNRWGIGSRTNYMVWVSLSEYKVRLYEGQQGRWKPILEAQCAIGAPGTPTVTGSFEYNYKTRWDYGTYYVGPCLVFYRGYALHSVLLYQNGTEYDGRTGVKISHGCIRLKKKDIDFIANTIPVGTRIYITQ